MPAAVSERSDLLDPAWRDVESGAGDSLGCAIERLIGPQLIVRQRPPLAGARIGAGE
jgi:hypothetical protein